jgi:A/G-specific adenine glycosylase
MKNGKRQVERLAVLITVPYVPCVDKKREQTDSKDAARRIGTARTALLKWHSLHGRHDLPWRTSDPYAVLVSEFMLQQTTVATVTPRFHSWMKSFPTVVDLASAPEQRILSAWEGLGYYSRALRLQRAARAIVEQHAGKIPTEQAALLRLPGVGPYTAAAILAFAHDKPAVVLDTNIIRVLARWSNLLLPIDAATGRKALESIGADFFPRVGCRTTASALMDLGATLCRSGPPECSTCPLQKTCLATSPEKLPLKSPRAVTTKLNEYRAWHQKEGRLFLEQSTGPRWRGLWILPELGGKKPSGRALAEITYPITRYRVAMKVFRVAGKPPAGLQGFDVGQLASLPMPSPHRKVIEGLIHEGRLPKRP